MAPSEETIVEMFQRTLKVERALAEALEAEGFTSIDEVAYVPFQELLEVRGLTEPSATQLRSLARLYLMNV